MFKTINIFVSLFLMVALGPTSLSEAAAGPSGGCIAYGDDYAFGLAPPKGWVLSCDVSEHSDVPVALWPTGSTWANAKVVMYVNPSKKGSPPQTLDDFVQFSVSQFRKDKPGVKISPGEPLQTGDHARVVVQHFTGDQWGNHEAVAYIESKTIFAIVVLSSRTEAEYKASYPAFEKLVSSYMFMNKVEAK
jgi:hypothetical protein